MIVLEGISKSFGANRVLSDVSLEVERGEIHAILGENGAGKSTLCNILFGVLQADSGAMRVQGAPYRPARVADALARRIAMVHQHFSLVPEMTVVDNILLGERGLRADRAGASERIRAMADRIGFAVDPGAEVRALSIGERQRLEIVKALLLDPELLILDEPTAVLPPGEIASLLEICLSLAAGGMSVLLVTHKLREIRRVADRLTVLRAGRVVGRSDAPARDVGAMISAMVGEPDTSVAAREVTGPPRPGPAPSAGDPVVRIEGISVVDSDGVARLDGFTARIAAGEIVAVAGVEGNGQSELANALSGMTPTASGRFRLDGRDLTDLRPRDLTRAGVGVVPEDRHRVGVVNELSVAENIFLNRLEGFSAFGFLRRRKLNRAARALMRAFDIRADGPGAPMSALSGGNQQKVVLARELSVPGLRFLVAAQPTRGLDVKAVASVYAQIAAAARDRGVAVLLISSELDEMLAVADRIAVLYRGAVIGTCPAGPAARARVGEWMAGQVS